MDNNNFALKLALYLLAGAIAIYLAWQLQILIICLILAITLASAMAPIAERAEKIGIRRMLTVISIYFFVGVFYLLIANAIAPAIEEQAIKLFEHMPHYLSGLEQMHQKATAMLGDNANMLNPSQSDLRSLSLKFARQTFNATTGLLTLIVNGVLVLFLAAYFVIEAKTILPTLLNWLPQKYRAKCESLILPLESRVGGYVRGQLLVALAVGCFLMTGLTLLGVHYSLILGLLSGVLNLVPYVGSLSIVSFAVLIAFNQSPLLAVLTLLLFIVEQWIESTVFVPYLVGKQVELHPLIVLLSMIAGGSLLGIPGVLISVPLASAGLYIAKEFCISKNSSQPISQGDKIP